MAGRPRIVRSIQSYINHADTHSGLGTLKAGTAPKIGVTHYLWYNFQTQVAQGPLDFFNNQVYYNSLQWQHFGNLRPPFRPSPRQIQSLPPLLNYSLLNYSQN